MKMEENEPVLPTGRPSLDRMLPAELLTAICDYYTFGDADTLNSLRTTSRRLRDAAWPSYAKYSFSFKVIPLTIRSIEALSYVAAHDRVAAHVKYLRLSTWSPTGSASHLTRPLSCALAQLEGLRSVYIYDGSKFTLRNQLLPASPKDTDRWQERGIKAIFTALRSSGRDASLGCLGVQKPVPYTALSDLLQCGPDTAPQFEILTSLKLDFKSLTTMNDTESRGLLDRLQTTLSNFFHSTPNLRSLDLKSQPRVRSMHSRELWHPDPSLDMAFKHVADLHLPKLEHVSFTNIRGRYGRSNEHLKKFIRTHAATIQSLELIDCAFVNFTALLEFLADEVPLERLVRRSPRMIEMALSAVNGLGQPGVLVFGYVQKSLLDDAARYWELDTSRSLT
ncbi:hypothetical protein EJ03DRAFT_325147 [Teratosphaeria nubilosa]|uniref:Uncharacterized protein n=1 Tax=Teratosphaeria nubilosa TaxID=161662 RepID=A0A6G1LH51_9PEZI|nr:hypothetical protein EJ03DRAFT_325147 [Teratosphaeria nubilosa]